MYCEYFLLVCVLTFNILDDLGKTEVFNFGGSQIYQFLQNFTVSAFCVLRSLCLLQGQGHEVFF